MATRVHLAGDLTMFREALAALLATRRGGIEVVGQSSTGEEAIVLIKENKPDVVITEVDTQLRESEKILSEVRAASPTSRITVLTMLDNLHYLKALSKLGVSAYLHKSSSSRELLAAIDAISPDSGGQDVVVSIPRAMHERLGEEPIERLSEWQTEIVVLAARGLSNHEIARELEISEATVKRHLANIYAKIGVKSRSEAVRIALMEQWIGLNEITAADSNGSGP